MADEYIKREDALTELEDSGIGFCDDEPIQTRNRALKIIQNIPAADVVEVVRCKDCKYSSDGNDERVCHCEASPVILPVSPDFFCGCGIRREVQHDN